MARDTQCHANRMYSGINARKCMAQPTVPTANENDNTHKVCKRMPIAKCTLHHLHLLTPLLLHIWLFFFLCLLCANSSENRRIVRFAYFTYHSGVWGVHMLWHTVVEQQQPTYPHSEAYFGCNYTREYGLIQCFALRKMFNLYVAEQMSYQTNQTV